MKILYISGLAMSDCDIPLVRSLQQQGNKIYYVNLITESRCRGGAIDLKNAKVPIGITRADSINELSFLSSFIKLKQMFIIKLKGDGSRKYISTWFIFLRFLLFVLKIRPDVIHLVTPLAQQWKFIYKFNIPIIGVVHDPLRHSSFTGCQEEIDRLVYFNRCDKLVLLSKSLTEGFVNKYNINPNKISYAQLGEYECMHLVEDIDSECFEFKYILFFGQIQSHKGLDYLCEAMTLIHKKHPDIHLVIAGKGDIYFDWSKYESLNYFHLINDYISMQLLASLLKRSLFSVCPYNDATQSGCVQTAFTLNVPLIVTNVGDLPNAVQDGIMGIVIPPCNVDALVNAIDILLSDSNMLETLKNNIKTMWHTQMNWEKISKQYINIYNLVC